MASSSFFAPSNAGGTVADELKCVAEESLRSCETLVARLDGSKGASYTDAMRRLSDLRDVADTVRDHAYTKHVS